VTAPLPVTIIGGYLGSGKTTLVNHLLRHADGLRLGVLVNEFGELAIDADLIEAEDDDIISIAGGCVCCSFGSDLTSALLQMAKMDPRPDHLLVECSGVAIPSAVVGSITLLDDFRADGIIVLADAETVRRSARDKYMSDTVLRQITDANIIILNKTDLVVTTDLEKTINWLNEQSPNVRIIETEHSGVAPEVVLDSFLVKAMVSGPYQHVENIEMLTLPVPNPVDVDKLAQRLADGSSGLIRAKGFATSTTGQRTLIQVVGNRWYTSKAPDDMKNGVVCLGFKGELPELSSFL